MKLQSSVGKDSILLAARRLDEVKFRDYPCSLFQDLAPATLLQRHQFCPVMEKLHEEKICYRWLVPFGIAFEHQGKTYQTCSLEKGAKILGVPLESPAVPDSGGAAGTSGISAWLNNVAGWSVPAYWVPRNALSSR